MSEQNELNLEEAGGVDSVEKYKFEPIKGYPMLHWHGKRPFTSTQYYPAQKKEIYGEEVNGWINKLFWGDNLQVLSHLLKKYRKKVDLIYIDPPFDSNAEYKKTIKVKGKKIDGDVSSFEEKQYSDIWSNDGYLQFMYDRLVLSREFISEEGCLFLHCDPARSHYLKIILDEIFGAENFVNEIIWKRSGAKGLTSNQFPDSHDVIFYFAKNKERHSWKKQHGIYTEEHLKKYRYDDGDGRKYMMDNLQNPNPDRPNLTFEFNGHLRCWRWTQERMNKANEENRIAFAKNGMPYLKRYLDEGLGPVITDTWLDIAPINSQAKERVNYPTQKPLELLDRVISCSTVEGSLVMDFFMGSGTTLISALSLNRRFIGADINLGAIQTATKRIVKYSEDEEVGPGVEVYNVNNYDIFRNPDEAHAMLLEALEIMPLSGSVYDGEKDGYMVKLMPINRIANRTDLNELISNFPYKVFDQRKESDPGKPVESLMLVCMGHEPDLKAYLEQECGYKLDVKVVDVLRDNSTLEFKRESEAEVKVTGSMLTIENFYPLNLMQKLSIQKESVSEWRELVESVVIDWNYDGSAMEPSVVDLPHVDEFVLGSYEIPESAGTIKIKITDLLSESIEEVVQYG